ncbi:MAG: phosphate/phosphite/phosphonate ABC transporter substrate-binding protein [Deltaproteobacteria bacterium]|nr:phosphate/phosphite/phosphonate ABC transporter substrate-binding protein [Deltaproteobacteria bacterium]MBT6488728.1 phosphate/phosphite/phosphonate ABC transporter substrate-binding protein [Deltaproteobacteria bacterium]
MNFLFFTLITASIATTQPAGLFLGDLAPPVGGVNSNGQEENIAFSGKPMVIGFYSSWDAEAQAFLVRMDKLSKSYAGADIGVVAIAKEQGKSALAAPVPGAMLKQLADPFGVVSNRYMVQTTPQVFIVSAKGYLVFKGGPQDLKELDEKISQLTNLAPAGIADLEFKSKVKTAAMRFARAPAAKEASNRWRPLALHMGQSAQVPIRMFQEPGYQEFQEGIRSGAYEIFNAGPTLCYLGREQYEPLALIERAGKRSYTGITFVSRSSKIKSISDLRGKNVGMVSPNSTSGGIYPRKMMLDAGLKPSRDVRIKWFGSHEKVAEAVKRRWVHAGACFDDCRDLVWTRTAEKHRATRILAYTPPIPGEMIMVRKNLPPAIKAALKKSLLQAAMRVGLLQQISENELPISDIVEAVSTDLNAIGAVLEQVEQESRD